MCKKLIYLVSFVFVLSMVLTSTANADDPNLVGWWKFDGDTLDSSGNGRDGVLIADAELVDVGILGGAVSLDGSGDYVTIPGYKGINADRTDPNNPFQRPFSVACWIQWRGNGSLVNWGSSDGTGVGGQYQNFRIDGGRLRAEHGNGRFRGATLVNDGDWHHVAMTVAEGANIEPPATQLYVDGQMDTQGADTVNAQNIWNITEDADVGIGTRASHGANRLFNGMFDDVRIYDRVLDANEVAELALRPKSWKPDPATGSLVEDVSILLGWAPGGYAVEHDVYVGTTAELGADQLLGRQAIATAFAAGLEKDTTYYWKVDDITADGTVIPGDVWSFWVPPKSAYDPSPIDGNKILDLTVNLTWTAGFTPIMHQTYFGTEPDQVAAAAGAPLVMDIGLDPGPLEPGTTYYWRVDEFYGVETIAGPVWSFSTVPILPLSDDPNLVGQWTFDGDSGGVVLDQSGHGGHASLVGDVQLVEGVDGDALEFDGSGGDYAEAAGHTGVTGTHSRTVSAWIKTADYGEIASWGLNSAGQKWIFRVQESNGTLGAIRVEVNGGYQVGSIDVRDGEWHHVAAVLGDDGSPDVEEISLYVDGFLENSSAQLDEPVDTADGVVRIGQSPWGSRPFVGRIDDVRIYDKTFTEDEMRQLHGNLAIAWQPQPAIGASGDIWTMLSLSWTPGDGAVEHDIYLGTDSDAVAAADASDATGIYRGRQADTMYVAADGLAFDKAHFWRIDEVTADGTISTGRIWSFTTTDEIVLYDVETPLPYDNSAEPFLSEISLELDPAQDWSGGCDKGIGALAISYTGQPAPGSVSLDEATGAYTIIGRGDDIWGISDQFQYAYATLTGDGSMIVKVDSLAHTDDWTKAGIMIRQTLDPGSAFAAVYATGVNGVRFQARASADADATSDTSVATDEQMALVPPVWLKIERTFPMVNAYYSSDGVAWTPMSWNPQVIPMTPLPIYIGLAVTSHSGESTFAEAVFSNLSSTGGVAEGPLTSIEIGMESNAAEPMYLILDDASGGMAAVLNPDPAATQQASATDWIIDLDEFGIDRTAVTGATLVIGNLDAPAAGGAGTLTINNVRLLGDCEPVAHWTLDEGAGTIAVDSSRGGGNDGILNGDPLWVAGIIGGALELDGVDDYVDCGNPSMLDFGTGDFTISAWINLTAIERATVYAKGGDNSGGIRYTLAMGEANDNQMTLTTDDDSTKVQARGGTVVNDGAWHHVVGMRSGTDSLVYVDGIFDGSETLPEGYDLSGTTQHNALIGAITSNEDGSLEKYFMGLIDDVRIYDRALSEDEVAELAGL